MVSVYKKVLLRKEPEGGTLFELYNKKDELPYKKKSKAPKVVEKRINASEVSHKDNVNNGD